jgi:hypothetical protein
MRGKSIPQPLENSLEAFQVIKRAPLNTGKESKSSVAFMDTRCSPVTDSEPV